MQVTDPLQQAIAACAEQGWRLQSATANTAAMVYSRDVNHAMHSILSLLTCGVWLFVWLFIAASNRQHSMLILVDDAGNVSYQQSR